MRAEAAIPFRARNGLHRPERTAPRRKIDEIQAGICTGSPLSITRPVKVSRPARIGCACRNAMISGVQPDSALSRRARFACRLSFPFPVRSLVR